MEYIKNDNSNYQMIYVKGLSISIKDNELVFHNKAILVINKIFHEAELSLIYDFFNLIRDKEFFKIVFSDLSVYTIACEFNLEKELIYDANTLTTNFEDFNFWNEMNIYGCFISPFITIEDLRIIGNSKKIKLFFLGYGALNIFYSHRPLITNYFLNLEIDPKKYLGRVLSLKEELREEKFPIIEKNGDTVIYSPYIFSALDYIDDISKYVDFLYIDDSLDNLEVTDGFLNKRTVYRR